MKELKLQRGITLLTLVITIVILLIIAGVTISKVSDSGLIGKAEQSVNDTEKQSLIEEIYAKIYKVKLKNRGKITNEQLTEILELYGEILSENEEITGVNTQYGIITLEEIYSSISDSSSNN